jgi:hypothetical protein
MRCKRVAAAATAGVAVAALLTGTPAGAQELLPIDVSPTSGPPGTLITVSGEECIGEGGPGVVDVSVFFDDEEDPAFGFSTEPGEVADDGTWSIAFIFEDTDPPGLYDVTATCFVDAESEEVIVDYDFVTVELTKPPAPPTTQPPTTPPTTPPAPPAAPVVEEPTFTG